MAPSAAPLPDAIAPLARRVSTTRPKRRPKQRGRPAKVSGEDTRRRILQAARECFAAYGYAATSNRIIADRTGLTTAAVYHHFGRKSDLMLAVYEATEAESYARIRAALDGKQGIIEKAHTLLDVIHEIVAEDRATAAFMFVAREESRRHEELGTISFDGIMAELFAEVVDQAIEERELAARDAKLVRAVFVVLTAGLATFGTEQSPDAHAIATEGCKRLIAGTLLTDPKRPKPGKRPAVGRQAGARR
jgi:AcrR family transcriptional regulator